LAEEAIPIKIWERDDFADFLKVIPTWIYSAVIWYVFTKLVLDKLSPKKPGTEINLAIIGSGLLPDWIVGEVDDLPPGVKLAALIDVSLAALDITKDLPEAFAIPPGVSLPEALWKEIFLPIWIITTGGGRVPGS